MNGDTTLGGEDFVDRLVDFCIDDFKMRSNVDIRSNPKAVMFLRIQCERAKKNLST